MKLRQLTTFFPLKMWAFLSRFKRRCTIFKSRHLPWLTIFLDSAKHFWVKQHMKSLFDPQKTSRSTHGSYTHQQEISQIENRQKLVTPSQTGFVANTRTLSRNTHLQCHTGIENSILLQTIENLCECATSEPCSKRFAKTCSPWNYTYVLRA